MYYGKFAAAGFYKIHDLLDNAGNFINFENTGLEKNEYLRWYSIICAIPKDWREKIKANHFEDFKGDIDVDYGCYLNDTFVTFDKVKSHDFYQHFLLKSAVEPSSSYRLKRVYHASDIECMCVYELPFKVTLDCKLRWLQYRITHGILVTNSWLHKIGFVEDDKCVFCDSSETIEHLYTECTVVNTFWNDISNWANFMPELNDFKKLYGDISTDDHLTLINQLLLIARHCIYVSRCTEKNPTLNHFKNMIKVTMCLEKVIALKYDKMNFHLEKWGPIADLGLWGE